MATQLMDKALTTLENLKEYLHTGTKSEPDPTQDSVCNRAINSATDWFEAEIGWKILMRTYSAVKRDGTGSQNLYLSQLEVTAVASAAIELENPIVIADDVRITQGEGILSLINRVWTRGVQNVTLTYDAGYAAIPSDVEDAVIYLAADRFYNRDRQRQNIQSSSFQGQTVTYFQGLPDWLKQTIGKYRIPAIARA